MPILEAFAVEEAGAFAADTLAPYAAESASGAIGAGLGASELGAGIAGAGGAGAGVGGAGISNAAMAADVAAGGGGAGTVGYEATQQAAANAGLPQAATRGITAAPAATPAPWDFKPQMSPAVGEFAPPASEYGAGAAAPNWFDSMSPLQKGMTAFAGGMGLAALGGRGAAPMTPNWNGGSLADIRLSPDFKGRYADPSQFQYTPKRYTYAGGGPVEQMSNANAVGANTGYPMANMHTAAYATPYQTPISQNVISGDQDTRVDPYSGEERLASGGIASYAGGGMSSSIDYYKMMGGDPSADLGAAPSPSIGIYHDTDPDTQHLDALTAAQVRMAKMKKRSNMQIPGSARPTPMGALNLGVKGSDDTQTQEAAGGGIMQAGGGHLGGYAAGGNPRLLEGPGDGMSDDIPATISDKQPARLADGEFVVPADVVSHLGNGSTDAGAKKLHHMMDSVRQARTGRKAQGKQINPNKYLPK